MPSERVSRERREAVAMALCMSDGVEARYAFAYEHMADAALQAALPDQTEFARALDRYGLAYVRVAGLTEDADLEHVGKVLDDLKAAGSSLIALVYGDDDASGGTR